MEKHDKKQKSITGAQGRPGNENSKKIDTCQPKVGQVSNIYAQ